MVGSQSFPVKDPMPSDSLVISQADEESSHTDEGSVQFRQPIVKCSSISMPEIYTHDYDSQTEKGKQTEDAFEGSSLADLQDVGLLIKKEPHKYELWNKRREFIKNLHVDAESELKFTDEFLKMDEDMDEAEDHAWSHRRWVLKEFGGWESELQFCNEKLVLDIFDSSAWHQRLFVVRNLQEEVENEKRCVMQLILEKPENEHSWWYFVSLHAADRKEGDDERLNAFFETVFADGNEVERLIQGRIRHVEQVDYELNLVQNGKKLTYALDALLHLACLNYNPCVTTETIVKRMTPRLANFLDSIYLILEFVCPLRIPYWKFRIESAPRLRPKLFRYDWDEDSEEEEWEPGNLHTSDREEDGEEDWQPPGNLYDSD